MSAPVKKAAAIPMVRSSGGLRGVRVILPDISSAERLKATRTS